MATKPAIPVNKKIPVATKQVPAKKPAPAKPAVKAVAKTSVVINKPAGVSTKKAIVNHVKARFIGTEVGEAIKSGNQTKVDAANKLLKANKICLKVVPVKKAVPAAAPKKAVVEPVVVKAKLAADTAVAKANLAKAKVKQAKAVAQLRKIDDELLSAAKASDKVVRTAAKKSVKVIDRKEVLSQLKKPSPKSDKPAVAGPIRGLAADKQPKKAEPAKKPTKAVKTKPVTAATPKSTPVAAPVPTTQSPSPAGSAAPSNFLPKPEVNKFLANIPENPYVKNAPVPPSPVLNLPPQMSAEKALEREKFLRGTFRAMVATTPIGS